jgi:hypothetical protein
MVRMILESSSRGTFMRPTRAPRGPKIPKVMIPQGRNSCYACSSEEIVGVRDRRPEGGELEAACSRHSDPKIPCFHGCIYCNGPVRKGSCKIDTDYAHKNCHKAECRD